jgi:predicted ATP-grasp superfamily ATP-dependent carboligase
MDLVRPLGISGIPCAVVAEPGSPPMYSRFVRASIPLQDASAGTSDLCDSLTAFAAAEPSPPVLYFEQDAHLLMVARNISRLSQVFRVAIASPGLVEDLVDKGRFQEFAERLELPVPPSRRIRSRDHGPTGLGLRYPVIVKPVTRRDTWTAVGGSSKALRFDTLTDLEAAWPKLIQASADLLVQEMIPGAETRVESYHVYVDAVGDVVADFTGRKIRTFPAQFGHSTALEITDQADVAALGREIVGRIGLKGVAKLDFKRDPAGGLHLLEVNPRFNLWHNLGAVAGVNLPALVYADMAGMPRPAVRRARTGARWCMLAKDLRSAREAGIPVTAWLPWAMGCEAKSVLAWDDPLPYLMPRLYRLRHPVRSDTPGHLPKAGAHP